MCSRTEFHHPRSPSVAPTETPNLEEKLGTGLACMKPQLWSPSSTSSSPSTESCGLSLRATMSIAGEDLPLHMTNALCEGH